MAHKGLNREKIITEALALIEEKGFEDFSMHSLAARLGVKTASLYNHVDNLDQIGVEIGRIAITRLRRQMDDAIRTAGDAPSTLMQIATAYRMFARENPELYKIILNLPSMHGKMLIRSVLDPMMDALEPLSCSEQEQISLMRAYRSMIHGFVSLETLGYFEYAGLSIDESYQTMICSFIDSIVIKNRLISESTGLTEES